MKEFFISIIRFYQKWISPLKPPTCRFVPTCSNYAITSVQKYGVFKGGILTIRRLLRCHPFYKGDYYDPVP